MSKKIVAMLMAVAMAFSLLPVTALAGMQPEESSGQVAESQGEVKEQENPDNDGNGGEIGSVTVSMDNTFVPLNATNFNIGYTVEPAQYADQITFTCEEERFDIFNQKVSENVINLAVSSSNKAGDRTEIKAWYNGEEVGQCKLIFAPANYSMLTYSTTGEENKITNGSYLNVTLGTPVEIQAVWDSDGVFSSLNPTVSMEWKSENESVADVTAGEKVNDTTSKTNVTVYQQSNGAYTKIYTQPTLMIDGDEYTYPNPSKLSVRCVSKSVSCMYKTSTDPRAVYEGSTLTFTFDAVPENAKVNWTCSKEGLMDFSEQHGRTVTVETMKGIVSEPYESVLITATATVSGHEYKGMYTDFWVWTIPAQIDAKVSTLDELKRAIADNEKKTIAVTETIVLPKDTNLDLAGKTIYRDKKNTQAVFAISEPNVTMSGGIIDGQNVRAEAPLISITKDGSLSLNDVTLQKAINTKLRGGAIAVTEGTLSCNGAKFNNNKVEGEITREAENYQNGGAAIYAYKAEIKVQKSTFENNEALYSNGGAVYFDIDSSGVFQGNTITDCQAISGEPSTTLGTMSSGLGGAIFCHGSKEVEVLQNTITNCIAARGGGILVMADTGTYVTMDQNTIQNCMASYRGGGLALINTQANKDKAGADRENNHIKLKRGEISGCTAAWGGGIDYSAHGMNPLYLTNVIITGNSAEATTNKDMGHGGGIWACPVSQTKTYSTLGGAIYGNSAAKGDDVMYEGIDTQDSYALQNSESAARKESVMNVSPRALGGGKITWFADYDGEYSAGISEPAKPEMYTNAKNSFGLHGELSRENAIRAEQTKDKLVIANNAATGSICAYGGGIATNSQIVIGLEGHDKSVTVTKSWSQETHPDSVTVTLMQKDDDNKSVALETVTLNKENQWTYTFSQLPGAYTDVNGEVKDYTYSVTETTISGWTASISEVDDQDNDPNTILFEIKNSPKKGGNSGSNSKPSLNTKDHYGYIIGYPVDYYTGQPTTDQTKKPVRPEGKITRAEVATIYFRMLTDESRTKFWSQSNAYSDVKTGDWFNNAVSTLSNAGIIAGYEDGSFRPNGYITRAEFATIAARFFDVTYNGKDLFPDISGHWAKDYINQAANKGFVNGYEDGTFKPDRNITRAEAVTLVNRTLDRHPDKSHFTKDMLVWPDNMDQTKWYYADMQEATNSHTYQMKENSDKTKYENWTKTLPIRNWEALEKAWSNANSSQGNGNVV